MTDITTSAVWTFHLIDNKTNKVESEIKVKNVITDLGILEMCKRQLPTGSTAASTSKNTHMAIGSGATPALASDTQLATQSIRKSIDAATAYENKEKYVATFDHTGTNYDIREAGIFTAQNGGIMINRVVIPTAQQLRSGKSITMSCVITHNRT